MTRAKLPARRQHVTLNMEFAPKGVTPVALSATYGVGRDGKVREVFCKAFKVGADLGVSLRQACMGFSVALQCGATMAELAHVLGEDNAEDAPRSILGLIVRAGVNLDEDLAWATLEARGEAPSGANIGGIDLTEVGAAIAAAVPADASTLRSFTDATRNDIGIAGANE